MKRNMRKHHSILLGAALMAGLIAVPVSAEDTCNVTFYYNYDGAETVEQEVKVDGRAQEPEVEEREGYDFLGWYTDEACTEKFVFSTKLQEDTELYAKWGEQITFEAEDVYMLEMSGPGASGAAAAKDMIVYDRNDIGASNGYYVTYLFAPYDNSQYNTTLEFKLTSDAAVDDARLYLRLTADSVGITINGDEYQVEVNGVVYGYDDISLELADGLTTGNFEDYLITSSLKLQEGENIIKLKVNNTASAIGGTTLAKAPAVDGIKISVAGATVTWEEEEGYPYTANYADDE